MSSGTAYRNAPGRFPAEVLHLNREATSPKPLPYADLNADNRVDVDDAKILLRAVAADPKMLDDYLHSRSGSR